jgi:hypothetical protein
MRTKTLLLTAAAMAAGLATSLAQSNVYSVNVVGYVNKVLPAAPTFIANPLDNGTNDLNTALAGVPSKSTASFWTGSGFTNSTKGAAGWAPNFSCPMGVGFFVNAKSAYTNTFVGSVGAMVGGNVTNSLPAGVASVGSILPYSGDLNTANLGLDTVPSKSTASFWTGSGYTNSTKGAAGWAPALPVSVADGFFINSKSASDWVQTLPSN